ncbi:ABC transporter type 1, transmembrane domain [Syntrophomonas zehnderi OL-4]|uniref:ABC transporter type 1, transmembrane domain n=1 Tax=Syntrophomonas zehnderi OL-4 TaxID=690567 RepID=A0A0E4GAW4_9FIRM|nr:ABC transporter ATP-binding protein [Syntrophomonas zehnderi]CFX23911.1 ABC transporter type 1, transmembrane domain [Syntrophomonas zehnderi OL-4]
MNNSLTKKSLYQVIQKNQGLIALLIFVVLGVVVISLIPPQILKIIIDNNLVPKNREGLMRWAIVYLIVLLFIGVFDFLKEAILTVLGQRVTKEIRMEMMVKLGKINSQFFSSHETGAVVSRFTNDVDAINTLFTSGVVGMVISSFKIIGIVISIWFFSYKLGLLTLLLLPIIYGIIRLFQKRMLQAQIKNRILVGQVNNHISESLNNMLMIKSYSKEKYMEQNYNRYLLDNFLTLDKVNFYDAVFSPLIQILRAIVIASIVILSSAQLNFLGMSLGMIAASIELISNLFEPVENLGMQLQNIQQAVSGVRRVNEFYMEPEEDGKNDKLTAAKIIPDRSAVRLKFDNVSFRYETGTDILKNINLTLNPLEKVTFVGRTGVGKSTLFKLIMGTLQPTEGVISINGIDVCAIPNREKRRIFGYVEQRFHFIKGTVAEQISLQDEGITRGKIEEALRFVGMMEYIESLENSLDTEVTSDSLFSQGQQQLLAIARAIVTDPPLLLLDEITANLDSITEERVISVLQKASSAHTVLSISHRLSSMIASDSVVILENGRVKNAGSPEVLLQDDDWFSSQVALERLTWH